MSISVEDFLVGPRGRRFLFELGTHPRTSERLALARSETVSQNFPSGAARYQYLLSEDSSGMEECEPEPSGSTAATADALAELLKACTVPDSTPRALRLALEESVDSAAYWRKPDGEDQLLCLPVMRPTLARIAEQLLPYVPDVWARAYDSSAPHVCIEFEPLPPPEAQEPRRPPEEILSRWRQDLSTREAEHADELRRDPTLGVSADWWSTPPLGLARTARAGTRGDVPMLGIIEDSFGAQRATCIPAQPDPSRAVLEIDHPQDWIELCRRHPLDVSALRQGDWGATTDRLGAWVQPDWYALAQEVDCIHLTVRGYLAGAGRALAVDNDRASMLAGFSPDETIWFTPISLDEEHARIWELDQDDESWHPVPATRRPLLS